MSRETLWMQLIPRRAHGSLGGLMRIKRIRIVSFGLHSRQMSMWYVTDSLDIGRQNPSGRMVFISPAEFPTLVESVTEIPSQSNLRSTVHPKVIFSLFPGQILINHRLFWQVLPGFGDISSLWNVTGLCRTWILILLISCVWGVTSYRHPES